MNKMFGNIWLESKYNKKAIYFKIDSFKYYNKIALKKPIICEFFR